MFLNWNCKQTKIEKLCRIFAEKHLNIDKCPAKCCLVTQLTCLPPSTLNCYYHSRLCLLTENTVNIFKSLLTTSPSSSRCCVGWIHCASWWCPIVTLLDIITANSWDRCCCCTLGLHKDCFRYPSVCEDWSIESHKWCENVPETSIMFLHAQLTC